MRIQFQADEGKILLQIDQAGAEALVVAYECANGVYRSLFLNGIKPHTYIAMRIFKLHWCEQLGCTETFFDSTILNRDIKNLSLSPEWKTLNKLIKGDETRYYIGKKTVHSSSYGMGPKTFQTNVLLETEGKLILTYGEASLFLGMFHNSFPEIRIWHKDIEGLLKRRPPILRNLFGFPRYFVNTWDDKSLREGIAFIPQSTVGTITNIAYTEIGNRIYEGDPLFSGVDLLQNGHDSILLQCPIGREREVAIAARKYLERDLISSKKEPFKMKTEVAIGLNWAPKTEENVDGLYEYDVAA